MKNRMRIQPGKTKKINLGIGSEEDMPCNDTNPTNLISFIGGVSGGASNRISFKKRGKIDKGGKSKLPIFKVNKKSVKFAKAKRRSRVSKYDVGDFPSDDEKRDTNAAQSRKVHRKICRVQRDLVAECYDKRILSKPQQHLLDAMCGIRGRYCAPMLSSDLKLRTQLGYATIAEFRQLWRRADTDPDFRVYHITLLTDKFQFSIRDGEADVLGTIEKCSHVIRQYTSFSTFGIYEAQAVVDQTGKRCDETLYGHIHLIAWTNDPKDKEKLLDHTKGYSASLTKIPILVQRLGTTEGDFTRLARYFCKPPYEAKKVNRKAYEEGKRCLDSTTRGVKKYHRLRLLELQSKLPLENSIFGVGEGVAMRNRIIRQVRDFHGNREGKRLEVDVAGIENFYGIFYEKNRGKLENYKPMSVSYRRRRQ